MHMHSRKTRSKMAMEMDGDEEHTKSTTFWIKRATGATNREKRQLGCLCYLCPPAAAHLSTGSLPLFMLRCLPHGRACRLDLAPGAGFPGSPCFPGAAASPLRPSRRLSECAPRAAPHRTRLRPPTVDLATPDCPRLQTPRRQTPRRTTPQGPRPRRCRPPRVPCGATCPGGPASPAVRQARAQSRTCSCA